MEAGGRKFEVGSLKLAKVKVKTEVEAQIKDETESYPAICHSSLIINH